MCSSAEMPHARRPVLDVVGERRAQAEIVERRRPKLPDEVIDVAIELLRDCLRARRPVAQVGAVAARVLEQPDRAGERRQLLAELIVHLARDAAPLVFLREHQPREQLGAGPFGVRLLPLGEVEVRADDAHDRVRRARGAPGKPRDSTWT